MLPSYISLNYYYYYYYYYDDDDEYYYISINVILIILIILMYNARSDIVDNGNDKVHKDTILNTEREIGNSLLQFQY